MVDVTLQFLGTLFIGSEVLSRVGMIGNIALLPLVVLWRKLLPKITFFKKKERDRFLMVAVRKILFALFTTLLLPITLILIVATLPLTVIGSAPTVFNRLLDVPVQKLLNMVIDDVVKTYRPFKRFLNNVSDEQIKETLSEIHIPWIGLLGVLLIIAWYIVAVIG